MSFLYDVLAGQTIQSVYSDSEVTYIALSNGTVVTVKGLVIVEPRIASAQATQLAVRIQQLDPNA